MPRITMMARMARLALAAMAFVPLAAAGDQCYLPSGNKAPAGIYPCGEVTDGKATHCCGVTDYCLSNGLCLNAGGSNEITQQGCTDQKWGAGCKKYCPNSEINPGDNYLYLIYCVTLNSESAGYCCGTNRSCCANTGDLISIPLFSSAIHPEGTNTDNSNDPTDPESTPEPSGSPNTAAGSEESSADSTTNKDSGVTGRTVGLVVGLVLSFFAMVVACAWLYLRHRLNRQQKQLQLQKQQDHHLDDINRSNTRGHRSIASGAERDSEMLSIEFKESPTMAVPVMAKSPPPQLAQDGPSSTSPSISTPATGVASTLPVYSPSARGYYNPDKPVPATPNEPAPAVLDSDTRSQAPTTPHEPYAELHGTNAAYEMSGEPVGPPQELDTATMVRNAGPAAISNHKYRF